MRRGLGQYISKGYGGAGTAARRLGGAVSSAGVLFGALGGAAGETSVPLDRTLLSGKSATEISDAIVEAVRPVDGTQDTEASRASIKDALAEVLNRYPDADLLSLDMDQRLLVVESYVASEVFYRFSLDLGKVIQEKAPTALAALSRLREVRDYVRQTVAAAFRKEKEAGRQPTTTSANSFVATALREALQVFESYAQ